MALIASEAAAGGVGCGARAAGRFGLGEVPVSAASSERLADGVALIDVCAMSLLLGCIGVVDPPDAFHESEPEAIAPAIMFDCAQTTIQRVATRDARHALSFSNT